MGTRLLTILGTGKRDPVVYRSTDGSSTYKSAEGSVDAAICSFYGVTHVQAFGTIEALRGDTTARAGGATSETGSTAATTSDEPTAEAIAIRLGLRAPSLSPPQLEFNRWPKGSKREEFWDIFESLRHVLDGELTAAEKENPEDPPDVLLNLTHGYRTQPLIAQAAVLFQLDQRRRAATSSRRAAVRFLYGAYGGGNARPEILSAVAEVGAGHQPPAEAELWDLTEVIEAHRWGTAVSAMLDHARADLFKEMTGALKNRLVAEGKRAQAQSGATPGPLAPILDARGFGEAAAKALDALVTARIHHLVVDARVRDEKDKRSAYSSGFLKFREVSAGLIALLPPLKDSLDELSGKLGELSASGLATIEGVRASLAACRWLHRTEQFATLIALLRETYVTARAVSMGRASGHEPGHDFLLSARASVEWTLGQTESKGLWGRLASLRNDVQHASYNSNPKPPDAVRAEARLLLDEVAAQCEKWGRAQQANGAGAQPLQGLGPFVNLTNHPSAAWPELQRAAALRLGSQIIDLPFPAVAPAAVPSSLVGIAQRLTEQAVAMAPAAVLAQGEHRLTLALVARLQAAGLACYCATGPRDTTEVEAGGEVRRSSVFRFSGFHEYPSLSELLDQ